MKETVIQVNDFRKTYDNFVAVDNISFAVNQGEIFGLLGPNGAGKTSTLESLEGLRHPDGGTLRILGIDPSRQVRQLRDVIGVQLQSSGLPDTISVVEAMNLFCAYHKVNPRYDLLERLGLAEKKQAQYHQLSAGQQRRLALVLALAHRPRILILDEPTAGLDVPARVELHRLIRELKTEGTTVLMATHDMAEAEEITDRVAILLRGKIATIGSPLDLTATGNQLSKISVRTRENCLRKTKVTFPAVSQQLHKENYLIYFSHDIGPTLGAIIRYIEEQGDILIDLRVERPSLEERFLEIINTGGAQ